MTQTEEEGPITARVDERPRFELERVRQVNARHLVVRFVAGGVTSAVAGVVTLAFGARTGGIFLAFPAILAASLTLIEQQDDSAEAREDARGAVLGGFGMAAFAAAGALMFGHLPGGVALLLAALAWVLATMLGYLIAWFR